MKIDGSHRLCSDRQESYGLRNELKVFGVLGGNHTPPSVVSRWLESADLIIAADAGLLRTLEAGYVPDLVIGDLDSIPQQILSDEIPVHYEPDQSRTDCQKLLDYVVNQGHKSLTLLCSEGDLMDHQIDAIHCAARSSLDIRFALERGVALIVRPGTLLDLPATIDYRVSLLPITEVYGASMKGVKWEIEKQTLSPVGFTSISNQAIASQIQVEIESGVAYLFIEGEYA